MSSFRWQFVSEPFLVKVHGSRLDQTTYRGRTPAHPLVCTSREDAWETLGIQSRSESLPPWCRQRRSYSLGRAGFENPHPMFTYETMKVLSSQPRKKLSVFTHPSPVLVASGNFSWLFSGFNHFVRLLGWCCKRLIRNDYSKLGQHRAIKSSVDRESYRVFLPPQPAWQRKRVCLYA